MNEEVLRQLILKILADPEIQQVLQDLRGDLPPKTEPDHALILFEGGPGQDNLLLEWTRRWQSKYILFLLRREGSSTDSRDLDQGESGACPHGVHLINGPEALRKKNWHHLFLPDCSPDTLVKSALGIQDTVFTQLTAWAIREGIPLTLATHKLGLGPQTPEPYRKMFQDYLKQLRRFGAEILELLAEQPGQRYEKKLLTEHDAFNLAPQICLTLPKSTIITPLARDTLKKKQIQLRFETEGSL